MVGREWQSSAPAYVVSREYGWQSSDPAPLSAPTSKNPSSRPVPLPMLMALFYENSEWLLLQIQWQSSLLTQFHATVVRFPSCWLLVLCVDWSVLTWWMCSIGQFKLCLFMDTDHVLGLSYGIISFLHSPVCRSCWHFLKRCAYDTLVPIVQMSSLNVPKYHNHEDNVVSLGGAHSKSDTCISEHLTLCN